MPPLLLYHLPPKGAKNNIAIYIFVPYLPGAQMAVRPDYEELVVIRKTYDLILWSCNHTGKFPRSHRFVLRERIERKLYDLLEKVRVNELEFPAMEEGGP